MASAYSISQCTTSPVEISSYLTPDEWTGEGGRQRPNIAELLEDRFRLPRAIANFALDGHQLFCQVNGHDPQDLAISGPIDAAHLINSLRFERYGTLSRRYKSRSAANRLFHLSYYSCLRPFLPSPARKQLQRLYFRKRLATPFPRWPVDSSADTLLEHALLATMERHKIEAIPFIWFWPDGIQSAAIITHDVETQAGRNFCARLMDFDDLFNVKSSFQLIPEKRYAISDGLLDEIRSRGFEINVHDLNHDGCLFSSRTLFLHRAKKINEYLQAFRAQGFRSAVMYRNAEWLHHLNVSYDMSIPNVAHLDPQAGGCCTVLPFFVGQVLELPVTLIQDYSLYHILRDYSIELWQQQIALIQKKHGLISLIVHPDYIIEEKARKTYGQILQHICTLREKRKTWIALPAEVADWWRLRSQLNLVKVSSSWRIEGKGKERAQIAYAVRHDGELRYELT